MMNQVQIIENGIDVTAALHQSPIRTGAYEMSVSVLGNVANPRLALVAKCNVSAALAAKLLAAGWTSEWVRWNGMNVTVWMP